jgi:TRAP-type mannitol/chloroaromatic compound transport system permease small subunit
MQRFLNFIDAVSTWLGKFTSVFCVFMVLAIVYEVIMRYVFNLPTLWVTESVIFAGALVYVIAGAWTMLEGQHVRVDFVWERFSARNRAILDAVSYLFFLVYILGMLWAAIIYAWDSIQELEKVGSPWNPPVYPIKAALAASIVLVLLQGTAKFIRDLIFIFKSQASDKQNRN